jgi:hypothetical protein
MLTQVRDGAAYEELLLEDRLPIRLDTEEDFKMYDRRTCGCEKPMVLRSAIPSAGTGILLRLCCLSKKFEEVMGAPVGTFYQVFDFAPSFEWDCAQLSVTKKPLSNGLTEFTEYRLGLPPKWIEKRMTEKGVAVKNRIGALRGQTVTRTWSDFK